MPSGHRAIGSPKQTRPRGHRAIEHFGPKWDCSCCGREPVTSFQTSAATMRKMTPEELRSRTKSFAIRAVKLFRSLPLRPDAQVVGKQVLRSATSVAANYRSSQRARSRAEFIAKIGVVVEEADETVFWLDILADADIVARESVRSLSKEANELVAIFGATQRTIRERYGKR